MRRERIRMYECLDAYTLSNAYMRYRMHIHMCMCAIYVYIRSFVYVCLLLSV